MASRAQAEVLMEMPGALGDSDVTLYANLEVNCDTNTVEV